VVTPEQELENEEVRNILRQPRYFDEDYEAAALRCFRCGQGGHRESECELPAKKKACHLCGFKSHVARDCPHGLCFNCLIPGHQSRDCPHVRGAGRDAQALCCLRCGKSGHTVADCAYRFDTSDLLQIHCYVCGSKGHLCCAPQDSMPPGLPSCCRCGGEGHLDSSCVHARRGFGGGTAPDFSCFHCGERGHIARECPTKSRMNVDFSRAPTTFNIGSSGGRGGWRGPGGGGRGRVSSHPPSKHPSRGYAAKYGGGRGGANRRQTNTGASWRGPSLGGRGPPPPPRWTGGAQNR
jgi:cellular nucleic acid-binding protein